MADNQKEIFEWEAIRNRIKESETSLTDEDLKFLPGREDEMYSVLALKLHKSKEEIKGWIESIAVNKSMSG